MRITTHTIATFVFTILGLVAATPSVTHADDDARLYLSGLIGAEFSDIHGSGFNTAGGFNAYGNDAETNEMYGLAIGRESQLGRFQIRVEAEGKFISDTPVNLPSFPGPPGPSSFFYRGELTDRWTAMGNVWIDRPISDCLELYAGGGLGVSGFEFTQTDGVVSSNKNEEDIAYQFGFGLTCKLLSNVELDFGYRRAYLGTANTNLFQGTAAAGRLNGNLESDQIALTFRIFQR